MVRDLPGLQDNSEFDNHVITACIHDDKTGVHGYISIHRGGLKRPAFGATRFWKYDSDKVAIKDVLRLSRIMTYKSALADCGFGGAKSVLCIPKTTYNRRQLLLQYAKLINYFSGHFQTGADVGITKDDIKLMKTKCPHFVGVKYDPVNWTLDGLMVSIKTCLKEIFGSDDLSLRSFAIQGLGKTGVGLLINIYNQAQKIIISDINNARMTEIKKKFPKVTCVDAGDILKQKVDLLSPCALGNILNKSTVNKIYAKIICGSANCQLENQKIGEFIWKSGILYAPDYIVNAGGLISVVDEYKFPHISHKRVRDKIKTIGSTLSKIIYTSKKRQTATNIIADEIAIKISRSFT
jgi:leucine dehydrogenase